MTDKTETRPSLIQEFRDQFPPFWAGIPDKGLFFGLLAIWSALFQFWGNSVFSWVDTPSMFQWAYFVHDTAAEDGYGTLIPFVVLGLLWWKRDELMAIPKGFWWPPLALIIVASILHLLGFIVQQTRVSIIAYCLGVYGLTGLVWGRAWLRATFFPMLLLAFCVPFGTLSDPITLPLRLFVAKVSVAFSHAVLGISVLNDGTSILVGNHRYDVAVACSGLRSLTALLIITLIYGFLTFKVAWKRCLIIGAALPIAIAGNLARLTAVIVTADAFGHKAAVFVETKLGFVTFAIAIGCMFGMGYLLEKAGEKKSPEPEIAKPGSKAVTNSEQRIRVPVSIVVVALIVASAVFLHRWQAGLKLGVPGLKMVEHPVYDTETNVVNTVTVDLPVKVQDYESTPFPVTLGERDWLPSDTTYGRRHYQNPSGQDFFVSVVLMGTDRTSIHKPEVCLEGLGLTIERSEVFNVPILRPHQYELSVKRLISSEKRVVLTNGEIVNGRAIFVYWFVSDRRLTAEHSERMWWMAKDLVTTGVLPRWAYVAYYTICESSQVEATFERMKDFIAASVPEFQLVTGPASPGPSHSVSMK